MDGLFVFDLFLPNDLSKEYSVRHHFSRFKEDETWNLFSAIQVPTTNIFQIHYFMEILNAAGSVKKWHYPLSGYQASFEEIVSLLKRVGLQPEQIYGDFNLHPYEENSPQMIFVCRRN